MLELLVAVDELNIQALISHVQEFLVEHKTEFYAKIQLIFLEPFINMKHLQIYGIFALRLFVKNLKFYSNLITLLI